MVKCSVCKTKTDVKIRNVAGELNICDSCYNKVEKIGGYNSFYDINGGSSNGKAETYKCKACNKITLNDTEICEECSEEMNYYKDKYNKILGEKGYICFDENGLFSFSEIYTGEGVIEKDKNNRCNVCGKKALKGNYLCGECLNEIKRFRNKYNKILGMKKYMCIDEKGLFSFSGKEYNELYEMYINIK